MLKQIRSKIFWKRVLQAILWTGFATAFVLSFAFSDRYRSDVRCNYLEINVDNSEVAFVDREEVKRILREKGDTILQARITEIDIPRLEELLNSHPSVEKAQVSASLNGKVKMQIEQRIPVARILNATGESYYLDNRGRPMPLSDLYTARVLVVNGYIHEPYAKRYRFSVPEIMKYPEIMKKTWLDDVFLLSVYLEKHPFWKLQVQQAYINRDNELELVPRVGNHRIVLGDASDLEEKMEKLKLFYTEGLNKTDGWNAYSTLNLKFKNQIICTKK